ncbi:GGDEF domain-containing protein [Pseudomonas sp. GM17]|uniref:GGDEF domain-containing protein n=1 Tax=Pseudomonas sp. GM17 TaxID=1144323 RepID=UPI00027267DF|nr:GGDEF domain-containing protein [Pseudomonas sp. GM17]WIE48323.1 GGDEF domain-containing protein [Pseudomonas sp. GM17]
MFKTIEAQVLNQTTTPAFRKEFVQHDFERLRSFCLFVYIASIGIWLTVNLTVSFRDGQGFTLQSGLLLATLSVLTLLLAIARQARHFQWINLSFVLVLTLALRLVITQLPTDFQYGWLILAASNMLYSASALPLSRRSFFICVLITWSILNPFYLTEISIFDSRAPLTLLYTTFLTSLIYYSFLRLRQAKLHNYIMSKLLLEQAYNDTLTGIPNRRSFMAQASERLETLPRRHDHYLAMIDVDNFKTVNDVYGHDIGDEVLKRVAADIKAVMADFDYARLGGEEFAIYLSGVHRDDVEQLAASLCRTVREAPGRHPVTISIGLARVEDSDSLNQALVKADRALYRSKHTGKDRYTFHQ